MTTEQLSCLRDHGEGTCRGAVTERPSFAGTGTPIPECEYHMADSYEKDEAHREVYPDSPNPPGWFDPTAAGERWDDDD